MAKKESTVNSLIAGGIAGAVEATITYPTEYVKTKLQLQDALGGPKRFSGPISCLRISVKEQGLLSIYKGLSPLVIGTAAKAAVRFVGFEKFKSLLMDKDGKLTGPRAMLAGMGAGMIEALLVVTPTETIKTKLIHDHNLPKPKYNGMIHGVMTIAKTEGISGLYRGLFPVLTRQGLNQATRFTVYTFLRQWFAPVPGMPLSPVTTFAIGMVAGTITVYVTMPVDVVKTKMQGVGAKERYPRGSFDCIWRTWREEGIRGFWKGATPRLSRLMFSGGIIFTVYEEVIKVLHKYEKK